MKVFFFRSMICLLFILIANFNTQAQGFTKIKVDPSLAFGGVMSDYFKKIEYIPLETTKESLFGDIDKIIVTDSSFVVLDFDTKAMYYFALNGKYISKVRVTEGDYPDMQFDRFNNVINLSYYNPVKQRMEFQYFSITGKSITNLPDQRFSTDMVVNMVNLGNSYFAVTNSCRLHKRETPRDSIVHLISIYKDGKLFKQFLPVNQIANLGFCSLDGRLGNSQGSVVTNGSYYISRPLDYVVYKVNKDTVMPAFQMVFPAKRTFPPSIIESKNRAQLDSASIALSRNTDVINNVSNIFYFKNLLFFKTDPRSYMSATGSEGKNQYNFIYDTTDGKLVSFERITPDSLSSFLPIMGNGDASAIRGVMYSNGALFSQISSLQLFQAMTATKNKMPVYPDVLKEYFSAQSRKSNPVIVKIRMKE